MSYKPIVTHASSVMPLLHAISSGSKPEQLADFTVYVDETSARLADGGLAGSILTLPEAVQNVMKFCHVPLTDVLPSVTHTPARLLGLTQKGWLTEGCNADLTLLNAQGEVQATIIGGRIAYSKG